MIPSLSSVDRAFGAFLEAHPARGLLIALSGGADSVVLLHLASRHREHFGYRLEALHVHHGIRGAEADQDLGFCQDLCRSLNVPLTVAKYNIPALAAAEKAGLEETARRYRYLALAKVAAAHSLDRIATAHTATDNTETVLLQLARGTASLHGIPPVRDAYIRPLLSVTRREILSYLNEYNLPHMEDSTNESDAYSRNLIRHRVLPVLRQLNPRAEEAFGRAAAHAREDDDYLRSLAAPYAEQGEVQEIASLPAPLRSRALIARCELLGIGSLSESHVDALVRLCTDAIPHASLSLPGGAVAIEDGLLVRRSECPAVEEWEVILHLGENPLPDGSVLCVMHENEAEFKKYIAHQQNIYKLLINTTLNFDTIEGTMVARGRRSGDRILSGGIHRNVKKLFCDGKIPVADRGLSPLIGDDNGILWIPALRRIRDGVQGGSSHIVLIWCKNPSER